MPQKRSWRHRSFRRPVVSLSMVLVATSTIWPGPSSAQTCGPPAVLASSCRTTVNPATVTCYKAVGPDQGCNPMVNVGAMGTVGGFTSAGTPALGYLVCYRLTAVSGPGFCSVTGCACGTLRIDNADGLPVELMDFSVE